jgi:hypothetical protein
MQINTELSKTTKKVGNMYFVFLETTYENRKETLNSHTSENTSRGKEMSLC